jgi:hypothetical protein
VPKLLALGLKDVQRDQVRWKHTYALGLDPNMRAQIAPLAKPYPKRVKPISGHPSEKRRGGTDPRAPITDGRTFADITQERLPAPAQAAE